MRRLGLIVGLTLLAAFALVGCKEWDVAQAATTGTVIGGPVIPSGSTVAVGNYSATNATKVYPEIPVGKVKFWTAPGSTTINYKLRVSGLTPNTQYFPVPYKDPYCAPLPGASAFPASPFTSDANGNAFAVGTVNPRALNPLGQFTIGQTKSISLRRVLGTVNLPPVLPPFPLLNPILNPTYNLPNPVTSSCDGNPTVRVKP